MSSSGISSSSSGRLVLLEVVVVVVILAVVVLAVVVVMVGSIRSMQPLLYGVLYYTAVASRRRYQSYLSDSSFLSLMTER